MNPYRLVADECTNGLKDLKRCFEGITFEDLNHLDIDEVEGLAETPREKALLKIFIKRYLSKNYGSVLLYEKSKDESTKYDDMDMSNKLISSINGNEICMKGRINFNSFVEERNLNPQNYNNVDFSNNNLEDIDLLLLLTFLSKNNTKHLLLKNNRFHCYNSQKYIDSFLQIIDSVVDFVDITGNPMATIDSKENLFKCMNEKQAQKLIWIPLNLLYASWRNAIDQSFHKLTDETHRKYYNITI